MRHLPDERLYFDTQYGLDFAKTITSGAAGEPVIFHFYWRGGISRKLAFAIDSFRLTQDLAQVQLWLWLDTLSPGWDATAQTLAARFGPSVTVKPYDAYAQAQGTPLEGNVALLGNMDAVAASDAMRLLVLWRYGGVYVDADTMALRDFAPLLASDYGRGEWGYRWAGRKPFATNAIAREHQGSRLGQYLLEEARRIGSCRARLLMRHDGGVSDDFLELPCPLFDPLWPHVDGEDRFAARPFNRFRDFFRAFGVLHRRRKDIEGMADFFPGAFCYQWHGLWKMPEVGNSYFGLFEAEIAARLNAAGR